MADVLEDDADAPSILLPCVSCNRTFRPEALAKHSKVCEKTLMKKRKKFDSSKQRIQGTDLAEFLPILPTFTKKTDKSPVRKPQAQPSTSQLHSGSKTSLNSPKQENTKWREKHNELVQTIKAARMPPGQAPVIKPSDHESCPYCERSFGPKAYDRHLEWCKEKQTRIQPKSPASQRAKERLEARTKYRAPPVGRNRRSVSRDKAQQESSPHVISTPVTMRKTYNKPNNVLESSSAPNINHNFRKGTPLRSSARNSNVYRSTQSSRNAKTPRPDSPKLNPEVVNEQVPEMIVTGYGSPEGGNTDLAYEQQANSRVISTYEIDISGNIVATSTPHLWEEEEIQELDIPELPLEGEEVMELENDENFQIDLNKTYTKQDLQGLLECSKVKERPKRKKKVWKKISPPLSSKHDKNNEVHGNSKVNEKTDLKNNIVDDYLSEFQCLCNYKDPFNYEEGFDENRLKLVEANDGEYQKLLVGEKSDTRNMNPSAKEKYAEENVVKVVEEKDVEMKRICEDNRDAFSKEKSNEGNCVALIEGTHLDFGTISSTENESESPLTDLDSRGASEQNQLVLIDNHQCVSNGLEKTTVEDYDEDADRLNIGVFSLHKTNQSIEDKLNLNEYGRETNIKDRIEKGHRKSPLMYDSQCLTADFSVSGKDLVSVSKINLPCVSETIQTDKQKLNSSEFTKKGTIQNRETEMIIKSNENPLVAAVVDDGTHLVKFGSTLSLAKGFIGKANVVVENFILHIIKNRPILVLKTLLYDDIQTFPNRNFHLYMDLSLIKISVDNIKEKNVVGKFSSDNSLIDIMEGFSSLQSSHNNVTSSNHLISQHKNQSKSHENFVFVFNTSNRSAKNIKHRRVLGKSYSFPNLTIKSNNYEIIDNCSPSPAKKYKYNLPKLEAGDTSMIDGFSSQRDQCNVSKINVKNYLVETPEKNIPFAELPDLNSEDQSPTLSLNFEENSVEENCDETGQANEHFTYRKETEYSGDSSDNAPESKELNSPNGYSEAESSIVSSVSSDSLECDEETKESQKQTKFCHIDIPSTFESSKHLPLKPLNRNNKHNSGHRNLLVDQTTTRNFEFEETTVFDIVDCVFQRNSSYSNSFKSTTVERDSSGKSKITEHSQSVSEQSFTTFSKLERNPTQDNLSGGFKLSSKSKEKYFSKHETNEDSFGTRSESEFNKGVNESDFSLPKIEQLKFNTAKHSVSEPTTLHNDRRTSTPNSCRKSTSLNSVSCETRNPSKLPVLIKKVDTISHKPVKSHWTEKYEKINDNEKCSKVKEHKFYIENCKEGFRNEYRPLNKFQNSPLKSEDECIEFRRHRILSPIASESASVDSCEMKREASSLYEASDTSVVETIEKSSTTDHSIRRSRQGKLDKITTNICRKSRSETVTVTSVNGNIQRDNSEIYDRKNCFVPPAEPYDQKHLRSRRLLRKESGTEPYDPYKSAERQMLELMEPQSQPPPQTPSPVSKPPSLVSSPTSAFTKFTSTVTPEPLFISENDNDVPKVEKSHASSESDSPLTVTPLDNFTKDSNQNSITLSTLSLCSTISIESVDSNKNHRGPERTAAALRRTVSAVEPRKGSESRRGRDPLRGILKMEDLLYGGTVVEGERYFGSPIITEQTEKNDDRSSSGSLHNAVSDAETLNAEQELLKSMSEFEKIFSSSSSSPSPSSPPPKLFPSLVSSFPSEPMDRHEVDFHSVSQTGGPDSAYSSLNRKSPVGGEQEKELEVARFCHECGASLNRKSPVGGEQEKEPEVARFCHECGARYPVLAAKFCCQCGVRRLVI